METRPTEIKYRNKDDDDGGRAAPKAPQESRRELERESMTSGSIIDYDVRSRLRCTPDLFDW